MACVSLAGGYMFLEGIRYFRQTLGKTCAALFRALSTQPQSVRDQLFMKTVIILAWAGKWLTVK